jgi:hypothetical protein
MKNAPATRMAMEVDLAEESGRSVIVSGSVSITNENAASLLNAGYAKCEERIYHLTPAAATKFREAQTNYFWWYALYGCGLGLCRG